jgi:hypothetical protein
VKKHLIKKTTIDVTGYDRSTIIWEIRSAYTLGYDEITVISKNETVHHLRKADKVFVRDLVSYIAHRLLGVKMESTNAQTFVIKIPPNPQSQNIEDLRKRTVKMIVEMYAELLLLMKGHLYASQIIEEKHDSITKLISFVKRSINTSAVTPGTTAAYHVVSTIDKIADNIKYIGRDYIRSQRQLSKTTYSIFQSLHECLTLYEQLGNKFSAKGVAIFSLKRDDVKRYMRDTVAIADGRESFIMGQATSIIELLIDLVEAEMMLQKNR